MITISNIERLIKKGELNRIKIIRNNMSAAIEASFPNFDITVIKNEMGYASFIDENRITYSPPVSEKRLVGLFVKLKKFSRTEQRLASLYKKLSPKNEKETSL